MTLGQSQVNLLTIKKFAELCSTTPRTLRFYEKKGIFKPTKIDPYNGYRYYDSSLAREFLKIKLLKKFDTKLSEIAPAIKEKNEIELINNKLNDIASDIKQKQKEFNCLTKLHALLSDDQAIQKQLQKGFIGPYTLFCHSIEKGEYSKISDYIDELKTLAKSIGINYEDSSLTFYLNHSYRPKGTPLIIALICKTKQLPDSNQLGDTYFYQEFPKKAYMYLNYQGPYDYLPFIYRQFYIYMEKAAIENLKDKVFELSIKGPFNTRSNYDYLTQIGFPVS